MSEPLIIEGVDGFIRGKRFPFSKASVCVGTDAACDVRLDPVWDKSVAGRHAVVRWDGAQWLLEDLAKGATLVEGRPVQSLGLAKETTIQLGLGGPKLRIIAAGPPAGAVVGGQSDAHDNKRNPGKSGRSAGRRALVGVVVLLVVAGCAAAAWQSRDRISARFAELFQKPKPDAPSEANAQAGPAQIVMDMGDQLFPSYLIASATMKQSPFDELHAQDPLRLGDKRGGVGVDLFNPVAGARVRVEVEENEMIRASVFEGVMPAGGTRYRVYPTINYRYEVLAGVRQTTPLSISVKVQVGEGPSTTISRPVRVASVNDCPFEFEDVSDPSNPRNIDMRWMFAAYVNENHPISDEIRQEALKQGVVKQFTGYQESDEAVFLQVFAFWNALQRRGVKYSSITSTPSPGGPVASQYVRFIDQSVNNSQANCVDGTVLFASLLRQIGIEPMLVIIPGHMLLGFALDSSGRDMLYLETTCIGAGLPGGPDKNNDVAKVAGSPGIKSSKALEARAARINRKSQALQSLLEPAMLQDVDLKTSFQSFMFAVLRGNLTVEEAFGEEAYADDLDRAQKTRAEGSHAKPSRENFARISILSARQMGVLPIAYKH